MIRYVRYILNVLRPSLPVRVLCETCGTVRDRIGWDEAHTLIMQAERHKPRRIACRTRGCHGRAVPLLVDDLAAQVTR